MSEVVNASQYILNRISRTGAHHLFGVPGDFILGFFNEILKSNIKYVGTCNELNAAYAADGYARVYGVGICATTYTVGELSAINGVAGAFAETIPVIHIGGLPPRQEMKEQPLLHHTLGDYYIPFKMYSLITCAAIIFDDMNTLKDELDNALHAMLIYRKPIYIGIPSDIVKIKIEVPIHYPFQKPLPPASHVDTINEALNEAVSILKASQRPVIMPGVLLSRHHIVNLVKDLIDQTGIPFVTMMLSKAVIDEDHERFIGMYCGERSLPPVMTCFKNSDCLLLLGELLTDFNTGGFSHKFPSLRIEVNRDHVKIKNHVYQNVYMAEFIEKLTKALVDNGVFKNYLVPIGSQDITHRPSIPYEPGINQPLTMDRFANRMAHFFKPNAIVIAETGASMFTAAEILMPKNTIFISQTFYGSIGYTVGATLGAAVAAGDARKVYLLIGDGSFQVTCQDVSTMIRYNLSPIIFLINNDGYSIERAIVDREYNDIQNWKYHEMPHTMGECVSFEAVTEEELEYALNEVEKNAQDKLVFIEIHLDRWDFNEGLRRAGQTMAKVNHLLN